MKFVVTEVEATFTVDGWPVPSLLLWKGELLPIMDIGRRWKTEDGIHLLARTHNGRVFELRTNGARWWAGMVSEPPHTA